MQNTSSKTLYESSKISTVLPRNLKHEDKNDTCPINNFNSRLRSLRSFFLNYKTIGIDNGPVVSYTINSMAGYRNIRFQSP